MDKTDKTFATLRHRKWFLFMTGVAITIIVWVILLSEPLHRLDIQLQQPALPSVTAEALKQSMDQKATVSILDLREADVYGQEHIPGAINVPFGSIWIAFKAKQIPTDQPVVVYHDDEYPGELATRELSGGSMNLNNVSFLQGGMNRWLQQEYPVDGTDHIIIPTISAADLKAKLDAKTPLVILDIRSKEAFDAGHLLSSVNVPHEEFETGITLLDWSKPWIVVLDSSDETLMRQVYFEIQELTPPEFQFLDGGFAEWVTQGFETEVTKKK